MLLVTFYYSSLKCCLYVGKRYAKVRCWEICRWQRQQVAATVASSNTPVLKYQSRNAWVECTQSDPTEWNGLQLDCVHQTHSFVSVWKYSYVILLLNLLTAHSHTCPFTTGIILDIYSGHPTGHLRVATKTDILFPPNKIGRDVGGKVKRYELNDLFWWNRKFITHLKVLLKNSSEQIYSNPFCIVKHWRKVKRRSSPSWSLSSSFQYSIIK